jgi:hypothetical protein
VTETRNYEPDVHYAHSPRPYATPCGKWKADVVVTYHRQKVTCGVCAEELTVAAEVTP